MQERRRVLSKEKKGYSSEYLTFKALESGTFKFNRKVNYSTDGGATWTSLAAHTNSPTINSGSKIMWKATLTIQSGGIGKFSSTGNFEVEGNVMSLLYGDDFVGQTDLSGKSDVFQSLFQNCTRMTSAEKLSLPATTLAVYCYTSMFDSCTSLTTAPELPATTLANQCYYGMFYRCTSLTTAPELPATTLVTDCYANMFNGCKSLNSITCLATNISANSCTSNWVNGVASSGTFTKAASMSSWTTGTNGIPSGWTVQNA